MNAIRIFFILFLLDLHVLCNENEEPTCQNLKESVLALQDELEILKKEFRAMKKDGATRNVEKRFVADGEKDIETTVTRLENDFKTLADGIGSTYVRWGRTTCPGNTTVVYKGYMGGNVYSNTGGPANYLCLPEDPTWAKYQDGIQGKCSAPAGKSQYDPYNIDEKNPKKRRKKHEGNKIFGSEYQIIKTNFNPFPQNMQDQDIPCVACSTKRPLNIMVPARTSCHNGWHLEYTGYLMTTWSHHPAASEYICIDGNPEAMIHGSANTDGNVMHLVEAVCGTLPCLPYVDGRELACSVCSK